MFPWFPVSILLFRSHPLIILTREFCLLAHWASVAQQDGTENHLLTRYGVVWSWKYQNGSHMVVYPCSDPHLVGNMLLLFWISLTGQNVLCGLVTMYVEIMVLKLWLWRHVRITIVGLAIQRDTRRRVTRFANRPRALIGLVILDLDA